MSLGFSLDDLPDPEVDRWNTFPWMLSNNSYSYGRNSPLTYREFELWGAGNPGWSGKYGKISAEDRNFPEKMQEAFARDGLISIGSKLEPIAGHYPITAWVIREEGEYSLHIERLNKTGYWSGKGNQLQVIEHKELGQWQANPRRIKIIPSLKFLGFWAVPAGGLPIVKDRTVEALDQPFKTRSGFVKEARQFFSRLGNRTLLRPDFNPTEFMAYRWIAPKY